VRIPNGIATSAQICEIGAIAREHGRDTLDITTRQQVQLRWIRIEDIPSIIERLRGVGLVTLQTGMDNIRNVVGCPVAGLTPNELFDASPVSREFTDLFVGNREFTNLPRKLNVTITGCLDNCTHTETQDIALVPARRRVDGLDVAGFNVAVGGKMGSGGYRVATPLDVFVRPLEAAGVAATIALIFRDHGSREARNHARLAFLVEEWGTPRFRAELERRLGRCLEPAGEDARGEQQTDHLGVWRQQSPSLNYVGLLVPVGRAKGSQFERLAALSEEFGSGEIRLTVSQNVILPNVHDRMLPTLLEQSLLREWKADPGEVARGTVSCTGKDFCSLALIETKDYALDLAQALDRKVRDHKRHVSIHWSGCSAGCGNHQASDIGFQGRRTRVDGEIIDTVDVFIGGSAGPNAAPGVCVMENVPCSELPQLAEFLLRYGDLRQLRDQLHTAEGVRQAAVAGTTGREAQ
ncbi:MAG: ferredoxin--nitrite reductase, partial [Dehalococcoidia bacterium]|nr:ferredoxin--nitrite reductase [Dehalococcoidia bacterium]